MNFLFKSVWKGEGGKRDLKEENINLLWFKKKTVVFTGIYGLNNRLQKYFPHSYIYRQLVLLREGV